VLVRYADPPLLLVSMGCVIVVAAGDYVAGVIQVGVSLGIRSREGEVDAGSIEA